MNQDFFSQLDSMPSQLRLSFGDEMAFDITQSDGLGISNVVVVGMGGSALCANIVKNWLYNKVNVPIDIVRGGSVPGYVNEKSLVIVSSYSGNTAETLDAYAHAIKNNAKIIVMCSGGKLGDLALVNNHTILKLPTVSQPRFAVLAGVRAIACVLEDMKLADGVDLRRELEDASYFLDKVKFNLSPDDDSDNPAEQLADKLSGKLPLIYASPLLSSIAYCFKISLNENAKQMAFYNTYSELDHNEIEGWEDKSQKFALIQLVSKFESADMKKRIEITTDIIEKSGTEVTEAEILGETVLQQQLYAFLLANYVSGFVAKQNKIEPVKVKLIEELKKKLT